MARIAVVRGGRSLEREISLRSGHNVAGALRRAGHDVREIDVDADLSKALLDADVAFIALHGRDGEDGTIQLVCEGIGVPYTGSAPLTCRFCFDKGLAKGVLEEAGVPTPPAFVIPRDAVRHMGAGAAMRRAADRIGFPLVVKPTAQGSALGLTLVDDPAELNGAVLAAFDHGDRVLLEAFADGIDISVALQGQPIETITPVEIRTRARVFDFETRVSPGAYELLSPPAVTDETTANIALRAAAVVGLRDFGRVDLRVTADGPTVLDVKTCPGLTESSIVPFAVETIGSTFDAFVLSVLDAAITRAPTART